MFNELINNKGFISIVATAEKAAAVYGGKVNPCRQLTEWGFIGDAIEAVLGSNAPVDEVYWSLIVERAALAKESAALEEVYIETFSDEDEEAYLAASSKVEEVSSRIREHVSQWHEALVHLTDDVHFW